MDKLTDKDKYTCITIKWSTYERIIRETDGDEYDGDENDTYEEDNYITKRIEHNHVAHFNVNLPVKKFIDKVVPYYQKDLAKGNRIYFDRYTSIELDELIKKYYDKEIFASLENISSIAKALNSNKIEIYHDA